jgi:amino acid adenylation domain-containing protein
LAELLRKQVESRNYEYSSLVNVQEWSEFKPGVSLFESIVVFENVPAQHSLNDHQLDFTIEDIEYLEQSNFPISIIALPGERLELVAFYDRKYFSNKGVTRLLHHLQNIIQAFVKDPDQKVKSLPLVAAEEFGLLVKWQGGTKVALSGKTVHDLFEEHVFSQSSKDAVICQTERISYGEINIRANRLAHYLLEQGYPPNTYHGIYIDRSIDMVIAMLAVLKSGAAYVPLDPDYPESRITYMLSDAQPATILTVDRLAGELPKSQSQVIALNNEELGIEQFSEANPNISIDFECLAYVIYTSGSTGDPKGVMITHGNLSNSTKQRIRYYEEQPERFLLLSSISFDSSVAGIFGTLCQGGSLYIPEQDKYRDVGYLANIIHKESITHILAIPSLYQNLLEFYAPSIQSLKTVIVAGEICSHDLVDKHWSTLPNTRLFNEYGPTEATVWSSVFDCSNSYSSNSVPIGRPIGNMQVYVLDKWLRQVPPGVAGELYLGGDSISPGYLKQPELTSEQFISLRVPNEQDQRLYKSGDLVCFLDDGVMQFLGRNDEQIKMRGYRIELGEIESALTRIRNVYQAAVVTKISPEVHTSRSVKSAPQQFESISGFIAFIVFYPGSEIESEMVKSSLAKILPDYMIPNDIIVMDSLPLNTSGKIDRRLLSNPTHLKSKDRSSGIEPRSGIEKDIANMWREILGIDQIFISDNFFELGGNSLMAVRLFAMIKNLTDLDLPLATLFTSPTLKDLVDNISQQLNQNQPETLLSTGASPKASKSETYSKRVISSVNQNRWNVVIPIRKEGSLPPLFLLHTLLGNILIYSAMVNLGKKQPVYGLQAVGLDGLSEPFQDLQKMMEHYVIELQKVQSHGPYLLAGWSVGGLLALELAHLLQKKGERILFLGMFDSLAPNVLSPPILQNVKTKTKIIGSKRRRNIDSSPAKVKRKGLPHPGILSQLPIHWPNNRAISIFAHIVNLSMCRAYKILGKPRPHELREWYLLYSHLTAIKSFKPKEYNIHISYYHSATLPLDDRPDYGWGEFTQKGVDIIEVSTEKLGDKFLEAPEFTKALNMCLQEIYLNNKTLK